LHSRKVALCLSDHADAPAPWEVTARHVYLRGHGPKGDYDGSYSTRRLRDWANRIGDWKSQGRDVFVYFDNDQKAAAPGGCTNCLAALLAHYLHPIDAGEEKVIVGRTQGCPSVDNSVSGKTGQLPARRRHGGTFDDVHDLAAREGLILANSREARPATKGAENDVPPARE
jgi:hypothetical protein